MKKLITPIIILFLFCFLFICPSLSLEASKTGLILWFDTLLPTLLPFLIISQIILKTPLIDVIQKLLGPFFQKIFHCSEQGAFCILCGFLCGSPVGARLISIQLKEQKMSVEEGQYLLAFCNNLSPMFCISYGIPFGIGAGPILPYLLIILGSTIIFGLFTRQKRATKVFSGTKKQTSPAENIFQLIDVCIIDSFLIMIKLCGYLIIFSIINSACSLFFPKDHFFAAAILSAVMEVTSGLAKISALPTGNFRTALALCAMSFGGLCCVFQTNSVISETPLSIKNYVLHKLMITLLALFFYCFFNFFVSF